MPKIFWETLEFLSLAYFWPKWTFMIIREIPKTGERLLCYFLCGLLLHFSADLAWKQGDELTTSVILTFMLFLLWVGGILIIAVGTEVARQYNKKTPSIW